MKDIATEIKVHLWKPRDWQAEAFDLAKNGDRFLLNATPGAGKTIFSGRLAGEWLMNHDVESVVVVVPTTTLELAFKESWWENFAIDVRDSFNKSTGRPPRKMHGVVVTYSQLTNSADIFAMWMDNGHQIGFVFDEVHHAGEKNVWGNAVNKCASRAAKVLSMSGTPFRSDKTQIAFLNYKDGLAVPDYNYGYSQAIEDYVCRVANFKPIDSETEFALNGEVQKIKASEVTNENIGLVNATMMMNNSPYLRSAIKQSHARLLEYQQQSGTERAGGLIVCQPGSDGENDLRHVEKVARMVKKITGSEPVVVTSDDALATAKINRFRDGEGDWIVAIRMVSEGVDIKRLRVVMLATNIGTELLFVQVVGRALRQTSIDETQHAHIFMPMFPHLVEWAEKLEDQIGLAIIHKPEREQSESGERNRNAERDFMPISASHIPSGLIVGGKHYSEDEVAFLPSYRKERPELAHLPDSFLLDVMRSYGVTAKTTQVATPPEERIAEIRRQIAEITKVVGSSLKDYTGSNNAFAVVNRDFNTHARITNIPEFFSDCSVEDAERIFEKAKEFKIKYTQMLVRRYG